METRLGYMDIKSSPIHFHVQRNDGNLLPNSVVAFHLEQLNVGGAMNIRTGVFTVPRSGTYHFSFSFMNYFEDKINSIHLRINGVAIGAAQTDRLKMLLQSSLVATLKLQLGDLVDLFQMRGGAIYDDSNHFTHFTGWLMEEDFDEKPISLPLTIIPATKLTDPLCQVKGFPKTCRDLRCRGHTLDGFYFVRSIIMDNKIDTIYCEFSNPTRATTGGIYLTSHGLSKVFTIFYIPIVQVWKQDSVT